MPVDGVLEAPVMTGRKTDKKQRIRCDACPLQCAIATGRVGACDRYANVDGKLIRVDPLTILEQVKTRGDKVVPFLNNNEEWNGEVVATNLEFITAVGAGTTYPDYKPAPFIVSSKIGGIDMVTTVTEGIFSYCGVKLKIDTDRHIGNECHLVRYNGEAVGHVTTAEYGSQMISIGGVNHLTGGSKREGKATCNAIMELCNGNAVELKVDGGAAVIVEAGQPPVINNVVENKMRVGCGSATIGMFAKQWYQHVDEVVVVDDHITGVMSEHQAGKVLRVKPTGIQIKGKRSTPGRYFQVAQPGTGWGGTNVEDPLTILGQFKDKEAWPGLRLLMVSTTGEQYAYFVLDDDLLPVPHPLPSSLETSIELIDQNCEPAYCSVLFIAGAGGSLRAGVTKNPVGLTRSVKNTLTYVSSGGAPVYRWPGGGITFMVDVTLMPNNSFGYVPTPAIVAPIEFSMRLDDYAALGGHMDAIRPLEGITDEAGRRLVEQQGDSPWPTASTNFNWSDRS